jgi:hypothetical protein
MAGCCGDQAEHGLDLSVVDLLDEDGNNRVGASVLRIIRRPFFPAIAGHCSLTFHGRAKDREIIL